MNDNTDKDVTNIYLSDYNWYTKILVILCVYSAYWVLRLEGKTAYIKWIRNRKDNT